MSTPTEGTIALTGFMGAGKTTVGACLADRLGRPFVDLDRVIEATHGPIPALFADRGEAAFRALEAEALAEQLDGPPRILATGGGTLIDPANQVRLATTYRVWLRVAWDTVEARIDSTRPDRPLWDASARARFAARQPLYADNADQIVDVDGRTPDAVVDAIIAEFKPLRRPE
ncbi:MAG: shikimate kinase [Myxococcota bacterium]